jgi:hypothetical protein
MEMRQVKRKKRLKKMNHEKQQQLEKVDNSFI